MDALEYQEMKRQLGRLERELQEAQRRIKQLDRALPQVGHPAKDAEGKRGEMRYDDGALYFCYEPDKWGRIAMDVGY